MSTLDQPTSAIDTTASAPDVAMPHEAALELADDAPGLPKRADARRNYEKIVAAAHDAFAEEGSSTSLEAIARRAGVGIGTLYRHFPTRQALLEAVYAREVDALCRSAARTDGMDEWEAFESWLRRFLSYMATKQALVHELFDYVDRDAPLFKGCRTSIFAAGGPLLTRAQEAGMVRPDVDLGDIIQMIGGIAKIQASEPRQIEHILRIALDGLRYQKT